MDVVLFVLIWRLLFLSMYLKKKIICEMYRLLRMKGLTVVVSAG